MSKSPEKFLNLPGTNGRHSVPKRWYHPVLTLIIIVLVIDAGFEVWALKRKKEISTQTQLAIQQEHAKQLEILKSVVPATR